MSKLWEVAPPGTWALLAFASVCLLIAFVLLSHSLLRRKARGDRWSGWIERGALEWTVRGGLALLLAGMLFWGVALDAPAAVLAALAAGGLGFGALQALAMRRGKS